MGLHFALYKKIDSGYPGFISYPPKSSIRGIPKILQQEEKEEEVIQL